MFISKCTYCWDFVQSLPPNNANNVERNVINDSAAIYGVCNVDGVPRALLIYFQFSHSHADQIAHH